MAIRNCPECGHQVSDRAAGCPGCGHPVRPGGVPGRLAGYDPRPSAPGAVGSLVCALIGLVVFGFIFGVIAVALAGKAKAHIAASPDRYKGGDLANAGQIMGMVVSILHGSLMFFFLVVGD